MLRKCVSDRLNTHFVTQTFKYGGGYSHGLSFFTIEGTCPLVRVKGIMNQEVYKALFGKNARPVL